MEDLGAMTVIIFSISEYIYIYIERERERELYSSMTAALEGEWSTARPGRTLPPGKNRYPFYRRLGGPQGQPGRAENLVPTGIRSRTVQPLVSIYCEARNRTASLSPVLLSAPSDQILFSLLVVNALSLRCSLNIREGVSHPYRSNVTSVTVLITSASES